MRRNQLVTLVGILTIAIAGCASETPPPVTTAPSPAPASPAPAPSPKAGQPPTTQPLVARSAPPAVPGLIPSTNAREREKQVQTEIRTGQASDPFSALPPELPKPTTGTRPVPNVAQLPNNRPGGAGAPARPNRPNNAGGGATAPGRSAGAAPEKEVPTPAIPKVGEPLGVALPPSVPKTGIASLPSTDVARGVEVTGVVLVGGVPQAIVIAPGEGTSRYVSQGQRIAGGRVLVKRIDVTSSEPVVILEENGIEVARAIGDKPPQATDAKPAA